MNLCITCRSIYIDFFIISFIHVRYKNLAKEITGLELLGIQDRESLAVLRCLEHAMLQRSRRPLHGPPEKAPAEPINGISIRVQLRKKRQKIIFPKGLIFLCSF